MRIHLPLSLLLLTLAGSASARILNVPADVHTIQAAIDSTQDSDTVLVQPGRYVENIDFNGHNIVVGSLYLTTGDTSYVARTVIDGNRANTVVQIGSGEDESTLLCGLTVTNGSHELGGGVFVRRSRPILEHCSITGNQSPQSYGGGIYIDQQANVLLRDCLIANNSASYGGGIDLTNAGEARLENCAIYDNQATSGGGIWLIQSNIDLENVIINHNSTTDFGGGLGMRRATATGNGVVISNNRTTSDLTGGGGIYVTNGAEIHLENAAIADNSAVTYGGGVYIDYYSILSIRNGEISRNIASFLGGGVFAYAGVQLTLEKVMLKGNSTTENGSAVHLRQSYSDFNNCSISGNNSTDSLGAISLYDSSVATIHNCVSWGNPGPIIYAPRDRARNYVLISFSDLQSGRDGIVDNHNINITWGDGNIDSDPLFADAQHGDYHLTANSPCIDAGDPDSPPDPDGTRADMGAYYFEQNVPRPVIYVEPDSLNFGTVGVGDIVFDTLTVHNFGSEQLSVSELTIPDQEAFTIESGGDPFDLQTGESHQVIIRFNPPDSLTYRDTLRITSNDPAHGLVTIPLVGRVILMVPRLALEPDTLQFDYVAANDHAERQVLLRNSGNRVLNVQSLTIDPWQSPYRIVQGGDVLTIDPDSSWAVTIRFAPTANRPFEAQLRIESDDPNRQMAEVALLGSALSVGNDRRAIPTQFGISAIYPNPFNSTAKISIGLPHPSGYSVRIVDVSGNLVLESRQGIAAAGYHTFEWSGQGFASGVYLCEVQAGGKVARGKLVLIR